MLLTKKNSAVQSTATLLFVVVLAVSAFAEGPVRTAAAQRKVADQLANFKSRASELRHEAETLHSAKQRLSWQTHSRHLGNIADHVNQLGKGLAQLEAMKLQANDGQKMAIEEARTHLVSVAENTTRAIELIKDNRHNVSFTEYGDTVNDLQTHAEALHTKLDTILDFENARMRLEALDLPSRSSEGS